MEFTKGEWKVISAEFTDKGVAFEVIMPEQVICAADAHLIAAAPKLYEALEDIRKYVLGLDAMGPETSQVIAGKCYIALAKAEGKC